MVHRLELGTFHTHTREGGDAHLKAPLLPDDRVVLEEPLQGHRRTVGVLDLFVVEDTLELADYLFVPFGYVYYRVLHLFYKLSLQVRYQVYLSVVACYVFRLFKVIEGILDFPGEFVLSVEDVLAEHTGYDRLARPDLCQVLQYIERLEYVRGLYVLTHIVVCALYKGNYFRTEEACAECVEEVGGVHHSAELLVFQVLQYGIDQEYELAGRRLLVRGAPGVLYKVRYELELVRVEGIVVHKLVLRLGLLVTSVGVAYGVYVSLVFPQSFFEQGLCLYLLLQKPLSGHFVHVLGCEVQPYLEAVGQLSEFALVEVAVGY